MHDYLVYHAKARTEGINIFQYTRVGLIDKIMQYIYYIYTRFWPLRAAARSTHERGGTGHRTMVETRVVHEYQ